MGERISAFVNQLSVATKDSENDLPAMIDDTRIAAQRPESGSKSQQKFAVAAHRITSIHSSADDSENHSRTASDGRVMA